MPSEIPAFGYPSRRAFIMAKVQEGTPTGEIAKMLDVKPSYIHSCISQVKRLRQAAYHTHPQALVDAAADRGVPSRELLNQILERLTPRVIDALMGDRQ